MVPGGGSTVRNRNKIISTYATPPGSFVRIAEVTYVKNRLGRFYKTVPLPAMTDSITETDERRFATGGSTERPRAERPALDLSSPYFFIIIKMT